MTKYKKIAEKLWQSLDNIDTASDIAKNDDKMYRLLVEKEQKKRFKYADSDGHKLTWRK